MRFEKRNFPGMTKRVVDLTAEELDRLTGEAWSAAAQEARAKGLPVTGSRDGRRFRYHPDGRVEDLGPVASPAGRESTVRRTKKPRDSAA
jgi:hypothetical protein